MGTLWPTCSSESPSQVGECRQLGGGAGTACPLCGQPRGKLRYDEKNIGYRRDDIDDQVLVPFGHGLGYTEWEYQTMEVTAEETGNASVAVTIRNIGGREGSEVVQLYASRDNSVIDRPRTILAGFDKIRLGPGEAGTASIQVPHRVFEHWDATSRDWVMEPGAWTLTAGRSVSDIRLSTEVVVG